MFLNHFEYFAPKTPGEALELIGRLGNKAKVLAGGTDLLIMMKEKLLSPEYLININEIKELKGISYEPGNGAVIGAGTKISEIEFSDIIRGKYYALHQAAGELGSAQVRHMATIGGNSCHASPAAETPPPLVALGATVVISNTAGDRELPLEEFILGNRITALAEGEILTKFILPEPAPNSASRYAYIGHRDAMEIDAVNMAVNIMLEDDGLTVKALKLVMGSVSPRPLVSVEVPSLLTGREFNSELVEKAAKAASGEAKPISDIRASAEYRREVVAVLTRRLLKVAFSAVSGKGV
ncbi:MAG: xanthine dehydrogenase family protein subunit M [Desulfotomaculaceae bacterium]|nr:xanthine dehydrogenase family protein subunit M [Desulfotomaculaceae bacterium]